MAEASVRRRDTGDPEAATGLRQQPHPNSPIPTAPSQQPHPNSPIPNKPRQRDYSPEAPVVSCCRCSFLRGNSTTTSFFVSGS